VLVFTQNVDGLHRRVGSRNLIEVHGSLHELHCTACTYTTSVEHLKGWSIPPSCTECRSVLRPDVALFGEALREGAIDRLMAALAKGFDMVFAIGTTAVFPYVAHPVVAAARARVPTIEINPVETRLSEHVGFRLRMGAADAMAAILARLPVEPGVS